MATKIPKNSDNSNADIPVEHHPWQPFVPDGAKLLIMGTFPPGQHRWSMEFYYPNRTNDFWFMMGLLFAGNKDAFYDRPKRQFRLDAIKMLLTERGIALSDTARTVRRLKGNASDKYLEILEPVPLYDMLSSMPACHTVATTGEKAAGVIASVTSTPVPAQGEMVVARPPEILSTCPDGLEIWRMPSTSRAYPLPLQAKADTYGRMFRHAGIL